MSHVLLNCIYVQLNAAEATKASLIFKLLLLRQILASESFERTSAQSGGKVLPTGFYSKQNRPAMKNITVLCTVCCVWS